MATGKNINELTQNTELDDTDLLLVGNKGTGSLRQITVEDALGYDSGDDTSPTAWEDVDKIESNEKAPSLFKKLTTMAKNVRWLFSKMGTTDISKIGDGTVMGALTSLNDGLTTNTDEISAINTVLTTNLQNLHVEYSFVNPGTPKVCNQYTNFCIIFASRGQSSTSQERAALYFCEYWGYVGQLIPKDYYTVTVSDHVPTIESTASNSTGLLLLYD